MSKLFHNMALNQESCIAALEAMGKETYPMEKDGVLWCNATWDSVLCWPAIPANTTYSMPCPPLKGLDTEKNVTKHCHHSGRWMGKTADDFSRSQGWTNFSSCMTPVVKEILEQLGADAMQRAQEIARGARKLEFVGLALSFISLTVAISILAFFRRLRVFRNQIHLQLMLAILLTVVIRLVLYIDLIFTEELGTLQASDVGYTINTTKVVCEAFYFLLEYGKTVAFAWMFIEGFYLHNTVVVTVFQEAPKLWKYLIIGWGLPLIHVTIWLLVTVTRREIERCLGSYYLHIEFWILDAVRLAQLVANTAFELNIVRVLWYKVKETQSATESVQLKKSVKAALMLIPLLGIPNIMQTIPFTPTKHNIIPFAIFTYIASFFYMFQGFMISFLYCFTNREVVNVIKSHYERYRLQHSSADMLRRGSRAAAVPGYYHGSTLTSVVDPNHNPSEQQRIRSTATTPTLPLLPPSYEAVMAQAPSDVKIANGGQSYLAPNNNRHFSDLYYNSNGESQGRRDENGYAYVLTAPSAPPVGSVRQHWQQNGPEKPSPQETSPLVNGDLSESEEYKKAP